MILYDSNILCVFRLILWNIEINFAWNIYLDGISQYFLEMKDKEKNILVFGWIEICSYLIH